MRARRRSRLPLWLRPVVGLAVATAVLGLGEAGLRGAVSEEARPPRMDRMALADVGAGAYVHRRDAVAGPWLEVVDGRVRTRPARVPEGISRIDVAAEKPPGTLRVVALGGSTTRGVPYDHVGGGFVAQLAPTAPMARWEVVNLGVPGMDARGVAELAREARRLEPDLFVVYTGNNEVMGDLLDACVRPGQVWLATTLDRSLGFRLLRRALAGPWTPPPAEVALQAQAACVGGRIAEAWSRGRRRTAGALDPVHAPGVARPAQRWDPVAGAVRARLVEAVDVLALQAAQDQVPVLLAVPPVHLRSPPGRALGGPGTTAETAAAVDAHVRRAPVEGLPAWTAALRLDPHRADVLHGWGRARLDLGGDMAPARAALQAAVDHDYAARRPTSAVQDTLRAACRRWDHVWCVDLPEVLAAQAGEAVLPSAWFVDHCHPSTEGNRRIAAVLSARATAVLQGSE